GQAPDRHADDRHRALYRARQLRQHGRTLERRGGTAARRLRRRAAHLSDGYRSLGSSGTMMVGEAVMPEALRNYIPSAHRRVVYLAAVFALLILTGCGGGTSGGSVKTVTQQQTVNQLTIAIE